MTTVHHTAVAADRRDHSDRHDLTDHRDHTDHRRHDERTGLIGWQRSASSSVLMAAVTAIACQLVFTALGFAIGATAAEASSAGAVGTADAGALGVAAGAWWLVTGAISLLVGGLVLGRLSGVPRSTDLVLAALAMWAVTAVFGFFVVWSGMMSAVTSPLAAMSTPAFDPTTLSQQGAAGAEFGGAGVNADRAGAGAGAGSLAAERAQDGARTASWWTVIGMLVGAAVAMGGAWMSAPRTSVILGD